MSGFAVHVGKSGRPGSRFSIPFLNARGQINLLLQGQQPDPPDLPKVNFDANGGGNPCRNLIHRRERRRLQERVGDACNDRPVLLRGGPHCEPLRINNKRVPFRLAFGETLPRK